MVKQEVITFIPFSILEKMARTLNSKCDFDEGFFTCDILKDVIQMVLKIKTKLGKHTLTEEHEKWTEKYQLFERHMREPMGLMLQGD